MGWAILTAWLVRGIRLGSTVFIRGMTDGIMILGIITAGDGRGPGATMILGTMAGTIPITDGMTERTIRTTVTMVEAMQAVIVKAIILRREP
jgi:hypothetical protein